MGLTLGLLSIEVAPEAIELENWITFIFEFLVGVILFKIAHIIENLFGTTRGQENSFS